VDYGTQAPGRPVGAPAPALDREDFRLFLARSRPFDFDMMLEIKDKEASARQAVARAGADARCAG
jgi:UV DNA damage endonuclease